MVVLFTLYIFQLYLSWKVGAETDIPTFYQLSGLRLQSTLLLRTLALALVRMTVCGENTQTLHIWTASNTQTLCS